MEYAYFMSGVVGWFPILTDLYLLTTVLIFEFNLGKFNYTNKYISKTNLLYYVFSSYINVVLVDQENLVFACNNAFLFYSYAAVAFN